MRGALAAIRLAIALLAIGCASQEERIVDASVGRRATEVQVDQEPWGLFSAGALLWAELDARALVGTEFGAALIERSQKQLPLPRSRSIDFRKDVETIRTAVYASARGDVATILTGRFDPKALRDAVRSEPVTSSGEPIVVTKFAGSEVIQSGSWSLTFLTNRTLAIGTEIGVRRVLERVEEGRVRRALPPWFEKMLATRGSSLFLGIDLDAQPVPATLRSELEFLHGLRGARLLGNFQAPGLNLAGTLTYDQAARAVLAQEQMEASVRSVERASWLLSVLKVPRPIRRFEASAQAESLKFAVELEGRAVAMGVSYLGELEGKIGFE